MSLFIQFKCLYYSFCYGFFMMFFYCLLNRVFFKLKWLSYIIQFCIGVILGVMYYNGLVLLNYGIIRMYFFVMLFLGYLFFMDFYKSYTLLLIEKMAKYASKIKSSIDFFFKRINAIIPKRKGLMSKCQRKKE